LGNRIAALLLLLHAS